MKTQLTIETTYSQQRTIIQLLGIPGQIATRQGVRDHFKVLINAELERLSAIAARYDAAGQAVLEDAISTEG